MSKATALRDMAIEELESAVIDVNKEIYQIIDENKRDKKLEKLELLRQKRKHKARLLTIISEKQS